MRPKDLLIYYGWLNSFNSAQNGWNNEKVALDMSKYDLIVFGAGIEDSTHGDYSNSKVIIPRLKELNPNIKLFGYVTLDQDLSSFKTKVDNWNHSNFWNAIDGIFLDEAGYDYGRTRAELNERIIHVRSWPSDICFVNAWNIDHVLGTENDTSYPNTTYNPDEYESLLEEMDWYLLESFPINTTAYSSSGGYEGKAEWEYRGEAAMEKRKEYGIKLAASGIINDGNSSEQALFDFQYHSSIAFALDAVGTSDTSYGSSSAKAKYVTRPTPKDIGEVEKVELYTTTQDADAYFRIGDNAKVELDFTSSSETSAITQY